MRPEPDCSLCRLCQGRTQVVYPSGNPLSKVVLVGEAPGKNEDEQGVPFVGRSGSILDSMLGEVGLDRRDLLITNTVKCRPPDNRDPLPDEVGACSRFLEGDLANAELVVGLGRYAVAALSGHKGKMDEVVNRPMDVDVGGRKVRFIATYHPASTIYNRKFREELRRTVAMVAEEMGCGSKV